MVQASQEDKTAAGITTRSNILLNLETNCQTNKLIMKKKINKMHQEMWDILSQEAMREIRNTPDNDKNFKNFKTKCIEYCYAQKSSTGVSLMLNNQKHKNNE